MEIILEEGESRNLWRLKQARGYGLDGETGSLLLLLCW